MTEIQRQVWSAAYGAAFALRVAALGTPVRRQQPDGTWSTSPWTPSEETLAEIDRHARDIADCAVRRVE